MTLFHSQKFIVYEGRSKIYKSQPDVNLPNTSHVCMGLTGKEILTEIRINFPSFIIFTQPLRSGRIWHKVNF